MYVVNCNYFNCICVEMFMTLLGFLNTKQTLNILCIDDVLKCCDMFLDFREANSANLLIYVKLIRIYQFKYWFIIIWLLIEIT